MLGTEAVGYEDMSSAEKIVYAWLIDANIPFVGQKSLFGGTELGGTIVDFLLEDRGIALRVMGEYWHSSLEASARDEIAKEKLMEQGYIVCDIWERNLIPERLDYTMSQAIMGLEVTM